MTKIKLIINPSSGDEKGLEIKKQLEAIYEKKGVETSTYKTTGKDDFKKLIKEGMDEGFEKILVSGGDGTISEIVNGIAELEDRPKIILLPSGTTNNFAQGITKSKSRQEIIQAIEEDDLREIKVDLGRMNDQYFISSIAVGLLPAVGWETDKELKAELGSFAYFLEGLKYMKEKDQESFDLKMEIDEEIIKEENIFLLIIGLSNSIFGVKTFFGEAGVNDGKLHYFGLKKGTILSELSAVLKQTRKNPNENKKDSLTIDGHFKEAKIRSESDLNFLIDGEKGPTFPVDLGVLEGHLSFIVPKE